MNFPHYPYGVDTMTDEKVRGIDSNNVESH